MMQDGQGGLDVHFLKSPISHLPCTWPRGCWGNNGPGVQRDCQLSWCMCVCVRGVKEDLGGCILLYSIFYLTSILLLPSLCTIFYILLLVPFFLFGEIKPKNSYFRACLTWPERKSPGSISLRSRSSSCGPTKGTPQSRTTLRAN